MERLELKKVRRQRRKYRIRKKIAGTSDVPRLSVYRSLKHIYAQIIDDERGNTLVACSTMDKEVREAIKDGMRKVDQAKLVGKILAKRALEKGIERIAFDRNGFLYHGRIRALADSARENGLVF
jgi:large subunit ribosomal protein L18